jgi:hypothetical protein
MDDRKRKNFTMSPNELTDLYTRLPDFKAEHAKMYDVLLRHYNDDYGYAWPSTADLMLALNCGENKVTAMKGVLRKYRLVETAKHPTFGNDVYFPQKPVGSEAAFYAEWPEAKAHYERRKAAIEARTDSAKARKAAFEAKVRTQKEGAEVAPELPDVGDDVRSIPW